MTPDAAAGAAATTAATTATAAAATSSRDRLLDAAERCLRRNGIRRTTMIEIADEAGTSRAWLYKNFPDKASLVVAALARTDEQFWADAHAHVSAADGIAAQVVAAVRFSLDHRPGALALRLQAEEPEAYAATVGTGLREMLPGMAVFWHPYLEAARQAGEVRADLDVARAAEWVIRVILSLVTIPPVDTADPDALRRLVDDFLVHGLSAPGAGRG
ncbi:MAG TPA: TetR/AcrR family transcriptional regulator [Aquihabitans sp.]|jgi:AcrR family transcriptional regulator|nr:TetR/AcrR family transcriptional regulator [Aquihabitans sp.]